MEKDKKLQNMSDSLNMQIDRLNKVLVSGNAFEVLIDRLLEKGTPASLREATKNELFNRQKN